MGKGRRGLPDSKRHTKLTKLGDHRRLSYRASHNIPTTETAPPVPRMRRLRWVGGACAAVRGGRERLAARNSVGRSWAVHAASSATRDIPPDSTLGHTQSVKQPQAEAAFPSVVSGRGKTSTAVNSRCLCIEKYAKSR